MMITLLVFLFLCIGAIVTFELCRLYTIVDTYNKYNGFEDGYIMTGVFWIVAAPFAFAVFFAKYGEKLKKRGKTE